MVSARGRRLFGIALGAASVLASNPAFIGFGGPVNAASAPVTEAIETAVPKLYVKTRRTPSIAERAAQVRAAIKAHDFAKAQQIVESVFHASHLQSWRFYPFSDFINRITDVNDVALEPHLDAWVEQSPKAAIPYLVRAQYDHEIGWFKRGHRFTHNTGADRLASFQHYVTKALADIDAAMQRDTDDPYAFDLKLRILRDLGIHDALKNTFTAGISRYSGYYALYESYLGTLQPRWGGSIDAMYAFVDQYAGNATKDSPLKLLYLSLYRHLLNAAYLSCLPYQRATGKIAGCMTGAMLRLVRPGLQKSVVAALRLYDRSDHYQFAIAVEGMLIDMIRTDGGDAPSLAMLEAAASSMHSNTQLKQDKPGQNNYVIDKAVAVSWYMKSFYENALQKNRDALNDIDVANFPSEEAKELAIAGVYRDMAKAYGELRQYQDIIAYEKAAIALDGVTSGEYFICYSYLQLKQYDVAIRACNQAVEDNPGSIKARYWRGQIYQALGQSDAALQDLRNVAESDGGFRNSAAINLSMIYFGRNDNRSALAVLNKYRYLYDPGMDSRDNIAVSYNNRCYAYMQLGELRKALDDCNASLHYGRLPDAYRKRLELNKRLGITESGTDSTGGLWHSVVAAAATYVMRLMGLNVKL